MHPGGEVAAARAAGTGYILSTISGHKVENVKAGSSGPVFYQLYLMGGRESCGGAFYCVLAARYFRIKLVTVDTPVAGMNNSDPRNGMKGFLGTSLFAEDSVLARHSTSVAGVLLRDGGVPKLENVVIPGKCSWQRPMSALLWRAPS